MNGVLLSVIQPKAKNISRNLYQYHRYLYGLVKEKKTLKTCVREWLILDATDLSTLDKLCTHCTTSVFGYHLERVVRTCIDKSQR